MENKHPSDIENTEELPVIDPEEKDSSGGVFPVFAKIGLFLTIVLVFTLISRFIYIKVNGETLSLIDDTQLVFSGHNGNGYADVMFHPESGALRKLRNDRNNLKNHHKNTDDIDAFINSIGCKLDYKDHLSNGMNVTYTCDYDENAAKKAGYHIIHDVRSYTVMGLSDYIYIDPYKDLETEWNTDSGSPVLRITPSRKNSQFFTYSYTYDGGNTAVIHVHPDEQLLHQKGYEVRQSSLTKTIPVTPAPSQVRHLDSLRSEDMDRLKAQASDAYVRQRNACDQYAQNASTLLTSDVQILSWIINSDDTCAAVLSVTNTYLENDMPVSYTFTLRCTGTVWKDSNGSLSFTPESNQSCIFLRQGSQTVMDK